MSPHRHLAHVPAYRDNPIVFFTTSTYRRKPILTSAEYHATLREIWERSATLDGWWVGHYILIPDHVHFFARPEIDAKPISKWVQTWKGISSRKIIKALNARSPIWQADYFDRYLRSTESYSEKWDYVEQNAVRAGLVPRAEDWALPRHYSRFDVVGIGPSLDPARLRFGARHAQLLEPARPRAAGAKCSHNLPHRHGGVPAPR